jgi:hypothetical protein
MQALFISDTRLNENYSSLSSLRVRVKNKPLVKTSKKEKVKNVYPKIVMPEQPEAYIKPRQHDCW